MPVMEYIPSKRGKIIVLPVRAGVVAVRYTLDVVVSCESRTARFTRVYAPRIIPMDDSVGRTRHTPRGVGVNVVTNRAWYTPAWEGMESNRFISRWTRIN